MADLTHLKATLSYQTAKNRFYGIWIRGEYSGNRFKTKYKAEDEAQALSNQVDNQTEEIRAILEHLVGHFAEKDEEGNWWGFDTNVGKRTQDFAAAIRSIKGQNLYTRHAKKELKYYKELKIKRDALATVIWGDNIPGWWKGSKGEWEVLQAITAVTDMATQDSEADNEPV